MENSKIEILLKNKVKVHVHQKYIDLFTNYLEEIKQEYNSPIMEMKIKDEDGNLTTLVNIKEIAAVL